MFVGLGQECTRKLSPGPSATPACDCRVPVHSPGPARALGRPGGPWVHVLTLWFVPGELRPWRLTPARRTGIPETWVPTRGLERKGQALDASCVRAAWRGAAGAQPGTRAWGSCRGRRGSPCFGTPPALPHQGGFRFQDVGICLRVDTAPLLPLSRLSSDGGLVHRWADPTVPQWPKKEAHRSSLATWKAKGPAYPLSLGDLLSAFVFVPCLTPHHTCAHTGAAPHPRSLATWARGTAPGAFS